MRRAWQDWLVNGEKEFTPAGNRRRPSYDVLQMVSDSLASISPSTITSSFQLCGVAEMGGEVPVEQLNSRLRDLLQPGEGLVHSEENNERDPFESLSSDDDEDD